jgi:hypothetical protein
MKRIGAPGLPVIILILLWIISCKSEKKANPAAEPFFPVVGFIKSQVAHVDTGMYSIKYVDLSDTTKRDTAYYHRDRFRELSTEFLQVPDISTSEYQDRFVEARNYDETINRVYIVYTPVDPEKEQIQRQEILIHPDPAGDRITSIIIDYHLNTKDSSVQKRMLWQADRSFQVVSTKQLPGKPETTSVYKVIWNEEDEE